MSEYDKKIHQFSGQWVSVSVWWKRREKKINRDDVRITGSNVRMRALAASRHTEKWIKKSQENLCVTNSLVIVIELTCAPHSYILLLVAHPKSSHFSFQFCFWSRGFFFFCSEIIGFLIVFRFFCAFQWDLMEKKRANEEWIVADNCPRFFPQIIHLRIIISIP